MGTIAPSKAQTTSRRLYNKMAIIEDSDSFCCEEGKCRSEFCIICEVPRRVAISPSMTVNRPTKEAPAVSTMKWDGCGDVLCQMLVAYSVSRSRILEKVVNAVDPISVVISDPL